MRLFETGKVGMFLDTFSPSTEKRTNGEVEVIVLSLRVQPFTSQLAASMDQKVRGVLFMLGGNAEPRKEIERVTFHLPLDRQFLQVFASSDTEKPSIAFDQVKVQSVSARIERGVDGYACLIKLAFGPASRDELAYINGWYKTQRSVTFDAAEPNLDYAEPLPEKKPAKAGASLPLPDPDEDNAEPEGEDEPELVGAVAGPKERTQRKPISHASGRKKSAKKR
jgi:hypothetical protein